MADLYSMLMGDGPDQQMQAKAMAAALRGERNLGTVLSMDPVMAQQGHTLMGSVAGQEKNFAEAAQEAGKGKFQQLLADRNNAAAMQREQYQQGEAMKRLQLEVGAKNAAQREAAKAEEAKRITAMEDSLRTQLLSNPVTKSALEVSTAFDKVNKAAANPSAAGDLSLVYGYMRLLDPGSSVKEGEFANAQNAAGVPEVVLNTYNRIRSGQRLTPDQRLDFVGQAKNLYGSHVQSYQKLAGSLSGLAQQGGGNPQHVAIPLGLDLMQEPPATPQIKSDDEYNALPSGTRFVDPEGNHRTKP